MTSTLDPVRIERCSAACQATTPLLLHLGTIVAGLEFDVSAAIASIRVSALATASRDHDVCFPRALVTVDGDIAVAEHARILTHIISPLLGIACCAIVQSIPRAVAPFLLAFNATISISY